MVEMLTFAGLAFAGGMICMHNCLHSPRHDAALVIYGGKQPAVHFYGHHFVMPLLRKARYVNLDAFEVKDPKTVGWTAKIRPRVSDQNYIATTAAAIQEHGETAVKQQAESVVHNAVCQPLRQMQSDETLREPNMFAKNVFAAAESGLRKLGMDIQSFRLNTSETLHHS